MTIALLNSTVGGYPADDFTSTDPANTISLTVPQTTVGNLIVVLVGWSTVSKSISSISGGATFTEFHTKGSSAGGENTKVSIYAGIATSQVTTVTVVLDSNDTFGYFNTVAVLEFSGATATESGTSVDWEGTVTTVTSLALSEITPDTADSVFCAIFHASGGLDGVTEDADFTSARTDDVVNVYYRVQNGSSAAQGLDLSWTTARNYGTAAMVAFRGAETATGSPNFMLLGVG